MFKVTPSEDPTTAQCNTIEITGVYSDSAMTVGFSSSSLIPATSSSSFDPAVDTPVGTSAEAQDSLYVKARLLGRTETASRELILAVCNAELVYSAGLREQFLRYQKDATA